MPRGMRGGAPEKAKDFKGTLKKLIKYMSAFKVHMKSEPSGLRKTR